NLADVSFLYPNANGKGSFSGSVSGQIAKPTLDGEFTLQDHKHREWTIQKAEGGVRLDLQTENATLKNVRVTQGTSDLIVNGNAAISGSTVDLHVQSNRVAAQDIRAFVNRDIGGVFAGEAHITALSPTMRLEGDLRAENLSVDNHFIGNARAHLQYFEP